MHEVFGVRTMLRLQDSSATNFDAMALIPCWRIISTRLLRLQFREPGWFTNLLFFSLWIRKDTITQQIRAVNFTGDKQILKARCEVLLDRIANIFFVKLTKWFILQPFRRPAGSAGEGNLERGTLQRMRLTVNNPFLFPDSLLYFVFFVSLASCRSFLSFSTISICFSFCCTW